jgi:hypothetical protein
MRRMLAGGPIVLAALVVVAAGAARSGTAIRVTVRPPTGTRNTHFAVRFRAPARTGVLGLVQRRYQVEASGKGAGCAHAASAEVPPTRAGQRVSVTLSGPWCAATYHGKLTEIEGPYCRPAQPCPEFATTIRTIGRFRFAVVKPSTDTMPPTFAGLQRAVQCFPGPQTPGEQRPVGLSWNPAADSVTTSSKITYDIYTATTSGAENFSQPDWTVEGQTSFTTPSLPAGRLFVVRARDEAGNEDHNTVERQALNPCL